MQSQLEIFQEKMKDVYLTYNLDYNFDFTNDDINALKNNNFDEVLESFKSYLELSLGKFLLTNHTFLSKSKVREFIFENNKKIYVSIFNQQSSEWYDSENSISAFDFILEDKLGLFDGCDTFLDLGGHQFIWSIYYAKTSSDCQVDVFEPSILNVSIGLFNSLINGVVHKINVFPYAITVKTPDQVNLDEDKMLVDFINTPVKVANFDRNKSYDFIKVDIEGYEYELLQDEFFIELMKKSINVHFELHLGHLVKRGVTYDSCLSLLKSNQIRGMELYSKKDIYDYLDKSSKDGFYGFIIN